MNKEEWLPTERQVEDYKLLTNMLHSQKVEFDLLSKKKSDEPLNSFKIKMVNRILNPLKELFKHEQSYEFLDVMNEDEMPTTSDVVLVLSQYQTAATDFKTKYYRKDKYERLYRWLTQENPPEEYDEDEYE